MDLTPDFSCPLCKNLLKDPVCCPECMETNFCKDCALESEKFKLICQNCNSDLSGRILKANPHFLKTYKLALIKCINDPCEWVGLIPDFFIHREQCQEIKINCEMQKYGCSWKGTLKYYNTDHKKNCYLIPLKDAFEALIKENSAMINPFSECLANLTVKIEKTNEQTNNLVQQNEELRQQLNDKSKMMEEEMKEYINDKSKKMEEEMKEYRKQLDDKTKKMEEEINEYRKQVDGKTKKLDEEMEKFNVIIKNQKVLSQPVELEWKTYKLNANIVMNGKLISKKASCSHTSVMFFPEIQTGHTKYQIKVNTSGCNAAVGLATSKFNVDSDVLGIANESWGWELYPGSHNGKSDRRFAILNQPQPIEKKILTFEVNMNKGKVIIWLDGYQAVSYSIVLIKNYNLFFTLTVCDYKDSYELISVMQN